MREGGRNASRAHVFLDPLSQIDEHGVSDVHELDEEARSRRVGSNVATKVREGARVQADRVKEEESMVEGWEIERERGRSMEGVDEGG